MLNSLAGLKKSAESSTTRSIRNRLRTNQVDIVIRYKTIRGLDKTRWSRPNSRDDLVNLMKIVENVENGLSRTTKKQTTNANFQKFI